MEPRPEPRENTLMPDLKSLPVAYHFLVTFFVGGVVPNPFDIRFRKVSGISAEINTDEIPEGGENLYVQRVPTKIKYNNLVLERGIVIGSPLAIEFNVAMTLFKFAPGNVLVTSLDKDGSPVTAWIFQRAYPVKWAISDLDANANEVAIETMELAYTRFQSMRF